MGKDEGRRLLERLVELRAAYGRTTHEATDMTVSGAIAYALDLMDDPERLDAIVNAAETDDASHLHHA